MKNKGHSTGASEGREVDGLKLFGANPCKIQQIRQLLGKTLITVITARLNTQCTPRVVLFSVAVVQGFIASLQPHLIPLRVLGGCHFEFGQGLNVIVGQVLAVFGTCDR